MGQAAPSIDGVDRRYGGSRGKPISRYHRPRPRIAQVAQPQIAGRAPDLSGMEGARRHERRRGLLQETGRPGGESPGLAWIARRRTRVAASSDPPRRILYERLTRREFRNVARNRPETTNLNHQNAIRRVFICPVLGIREAGPPWIAPKPVAGCE